MGEAIQRGQESEKYRLKRIRIEAGKRFPKAMNRALNTISEAAFHTKRRTKIPLIVVNEDPVEVLLASLVVKELKKMGFGVYHREVKAKIREYCVTWGKDWAETPEGFQPIEQGGVR